MTTSIKYDDITFYISDAFDFTIRFNCCGRCQGILSIDASEREYNGNYTLYKWFNEGKFPDFFDTIKDRNGNNKLKITGVDDI